MRTVVSSVTYSRSSKSQPNSRPIKPDRYIKNRDSIQKNTEGSNKLIWEASSRCEEKWKSSASCWMCIYCCWAWYWSVAYSTIKDIKEALESSWKGLHTNTGKVWAKGECDVPTCSSCELLAQAGEGNMVFPEKLEKTASYKLKKKRRWGDKWTSSYPPAGIYWEYPRSILLCTYSFLM